MSKYTLTSLDKAVLHALVANGRFNYAEQYVGQVTSGVVPDAVNNWFKAAAYINSDFGV